MLLQQRGQAQEEKSFISRNSGANPVLRQTGITNLEYEKIGILV